MAFKNPIERLLKAPFKLITGVPKLFKESKALEGADKDKDNTINSISGHVREQVGDVVKAVIGLPTSLVTLPVFGGVQLAASAIRNPIEFIIQRPLKNIQRIFQSARENKFNVLTGRKGNIA